MQEKNERSEMPDRMTGKGRGMQGIDKAPGEETPQGTQQVVEDTQKAKKVDADPEQKEDQPGRTQ